MSGLYKILTDMSLELIGVHGAEQHDITLELTFDAVPDGAADFLLPGQGATIEVQTAHVVENYSSLGEKRHEAPAWLWPMIEADECLEREMLAEAWESAARAASKFAAIASARKDTTQGKNK